MKKKYAEPEFELIQFRFESLLADQVVSDPENSGSDGSEFEGEL